MLFGCICLSLAGWLGGVVADESPLTVDSVQLGLPISSIDGEGTLDGSLFSGDFGEMTISVDSNNPTGYMSVWMQVNVSGHRFRIMNGRLSDGKINNRMASFPIMMRS